MLRKSLLQLTEDGGGSIIFVSLDNMICMRAFPGYTEIVYDKDNQIRVRETIEEILYMKANIE